MGLEPAFAPGAPASMPAFPGGLPAEPDDPQLPVPGGALLTGFAEPRDRQAIDPDRAFLAGAPSAPLSQPPARLRTGGWTATVAFSCLLHAAAAFAFLATGADRVMMAGSEAAGVLMLGNADADQLADGTRLADAMQVTLVTMPAPAPELAETVAAEAPPLPQAQAPQAVRPAAEPLREPAEPRQTPSPAQAAVDPTPSILTAEVPRPANDAAAAPPVEKIVPEPVEEPKAAAVPEIVPPAPRPIPAEKKAAPEEPVKKAVQAPTPKAEPKPPARRKAAPKERPKTEKPAKTPARKAGSGGSSSSDGKRGVAGGDAKGNKTVAGKRGTVSAAGNAAVSNYPGKVAARIRRATRGISGSARSRASSDVRVSFTVTASGGLAGLRIASSSGSPELDKAALAIVRRAAPFPPIPAEAGRRNWAFTLPLGIR